MTTVALLTQPLAYVCRPAPWLTMLLTSVFCTAVYAAPFSGMVFKDSPSFSPESLMALYQSQIGQPLDPSIQKQLLKKLVQHYETQGYLPPAPRIQAVYQGAGIIAVEMQEPFITRVSISGQKIVDNQEFWRLVEELKAVRPLSRTAFNQWLRRVNELNLVVQGDLIHAQAGSHQYLAQLRVTQRRWHGLLHMNNRAPEQLNEELIQVSVGFHAADDRVGSYRFDTAAAVDTDRLRYAALNGTHRILQRGDSISWKYAESDSVLPIAGTELEVAYQRMRAELKYTHALVARTRMRAEVNVGLSRYDVEQKLQGGRLLKQDRIQAARVALKMVSVTGNRHLHRWEWGIEKSLNTKLWQQSAVNAPEENYWLTDLSYRYQYVLNANWQLSVDTQLQVSQARLPSSERFLIGGSRLGGAFDPATLGGDQGLGMRFNAERQLHTNFLQEPVRLFSYYDHGFVRSNDRSRPADDAGSLGLGVKVAHRKLALALEFAHPIVAPNTTNVVQNESRLFFSISQQF